MANTNIGDVKFSLLAPVQFRNENGDGWILLNGCSDNETEHLFLNSSLRNLYQITSLPDARGVFIRGMNLGRANSQGDSAGDRPVGVYQSDSIQRHQHSYFRGEAPTNDTQSWGGPIRCFRSDTSALTEYNGGDNAETRPKNICLYVYVKIN